jgi:hypothetical protein
VRLLVALLAVTLIGATPVEQAFTNGETLDYNIHWMKITAGTARLTVGPLQGEEGAFRVTSVAKSSPGFARIFQVRDEIEAIVARHDFSTLRYTKRLDEDGEKKHEVTTIENGVATRVRKRVTKTRVPRPVLDPISVVQYLRTLDLTPNKRYELTLVADSKLYQVHTKVLRRETVETPAGTFRTVVVEPTMEIGGVARDGRLFIWYSDDERHIPVKIRTEIKIGAITATLRSVRGGVSSIEPPAATAEKLK